MSSTTLHNTIRGRFYTKVESVSAFNLSGKVQYDNQAAPAVDQEIWCRFTIKDGDTFNTEFGTDTTKERTVGLAIAQLFSPENRGDGALLELADSIASVFRRVTVSGVRFKTPSIKPIGWNGKEYQVNVEMPFVYSADKQKGSV